MRASGASPSQKWRSSALYAHVLLRLAATAALSCAPLCASILASTARAESDVYETKRLLHAVHEAGFCPVDMAEGQRIAFIHVYRAPIFPESEVLPNWLNFPHILTRNEIVSREILFEAGDAFDQARADEIERNLRALGIFSLVRAMPVTHCDTPDEAPGLLLYTRDIWSLRLEMDIQLTGPVLDRLLLRVVERNFLGLRQTVGAGLLLKPDVFETSLIYNNPRLRRADLALSLSPSLIFRRDSVLGGGTLEGASISTSIAQPFYNLRAKRAWALTTSVRQEVIRNLTQGQVRMYAPTADADDTERIGEAWNQTSANASLTRSRRFGDPKRFLFQASTGLNLRLRSVSTYERGDASDEAVAAFERSVLPRERREIGPTVSLLAFSPTYKILHELDTYGSSEALRYGPSVAATVRIPLVAFGSLENAFEQDITAGWKWVFGDSAIQTLMSAGSRISPSGMVNQRAGLVHRMAGPMIGWVRPVAQGTVRLRNRDEDNTLITLGGDSGLRGFASQEFGIRGGSRVLFNVELRSKPWVWSFLHLGASLFYDSGALFGEGEALRWHHSIGVSLTALLPQINREVIRMDGGIPLEGSSIPVPNLAFGQVIQFSSVDDPLGIN